MPGNHSAVSRVVADMVGSCNTVPVYGWWLYCSSVNRDSHTWEGRKINHFPNSSAQLATGLYLWVLKLPIDPMWCLDPLWCLDPMWCLVLCGVWILSRVDFPSANNHLASARLTITSGLPIEIAILGRNMRISIILQRFFVQLLCLLQHKTS